MAQLISAPGADSGSPSGSVRACERAVFSGEEASGYLRNAGLIRSCAGLSKKSTGFLLWSDFVLLISAKCV